MTASSQTTLVIVDRGVSPAQVMRLAGRTGTPLKSSVVFLDAPSLGPFQDFAAPLVADYVPGAAVGSNGENLVATAIASANRVATDLVEALQRSYRWRPALDYAGANLRSVAYCALASHLLSVIRFYYVVRENIARRRPRDAALISSDPLRARVFKLVAPNGEIIRPPGGRSSSGALVRGARDGARFARDILRSVTARGVSWPTRRSEALRVIFVAGNARVCEERHPNVFEAIRDRGMDLGVLCYPGHAGSLPVPHFSFGDVRVGLRSLLHKWRHWAGLRRREPALARFFGELRSDEDKRQPLLALLRAEAASFLPSHAMYVVLDFLETMTAAIRRLDPDVVFFDNRQLVGLCAGLAGRVCGVPTVWLQDGIVGEEEPGLMAMEAERCAAWGEATDPYLRGAGVEPARVTVVGAPVADILTTRPYLDRHRLGAALGIELTNGELLLSYMSCYVSWEILGAFAFSGNPFQHKRAVLESICRTVLGLARAKLVIKLHPCDPDREFDRKVAGELLPASRFAVTARQDLLYDVLAGSDLVILHDGSTTGVEAAALGRAMVGVDFDGIDGAGTNSWIREGVAVGVFRPKDMDRSVRAALFDPSVRRALSERREAFVQRYVYQTDGKNCDRFVRLLETISIERRQRR